ncbi:hypothetical protein [Streptomyces sp. NBC_01618]|uniref:hypothetical protein n=1 Tax=Streptomyces sp. NBC_01618 TaxID=2975900 RepID=UPI00386451D9|nr:hypothetical protein OH735_00900 [Streptomyces sp. NBC_01618]
MDPAIAEAVERQNQAMRELSRREFPESDVVPDDAPAPIEAVRAQRSRLVAATESAALCRARAERTGTARIDPQLERTARLAKQQGQDVCARAGTPSREARSSPKVIFSSPYSKVMAAASAAHQSVLRPQWSSFLGARSW